MKTRACLLAACVLVAGCGGGKNPAPKPISGPAKEVAQVIEKLQRATAQRDFATICDELLAGATREQAGGANCADVLDQRARGVTRPKIVIESIAVAGEQAQVRVRTTAKGQAPAHDLIRLARERGRFRVVALGR